MENSFSVMREDMRSIMPNYESMGQQRRKKENPVDQGVAKFKKRISGCNIWLIGVLSAFVLFVIFYLCDKVGGGSNSPTETATEEPAQHTSHSIDFELGDTLVVSDIGLYAGDTVVFTLKKDGRKCYAGGKWAADGFLLPDNSARCTQRVIVIGDDKDTATISFAPENDTVKYRMRFPIEKE